MNAVMKNFTMNRRTLSSYYISILIAFFLLTLVKTFYTDWVVTVAENFTVWFNYDWQFGGRIWYIFIFVSVLLVILIRHFIVEPLGFLVDTDEGTGWEAAILLLVLFGFYIYLLNQIFSYAMPREWWMPEWLIRFLGGYRNTFTPAISKELYVESWTLISWFWFIAPLAMIWVRTRIALKK